MFENRLSKNAAAILAVSILLTFGFVTFPCAAQTGWTTNTAGDRVWTTSQTAFVGIGTTTPDSRFTIAGAETFRYAPNLQVRLVDIDFNHYVNADVSRNGAAMRIDLRPDQAARFLWMTRDANQPLPGNTETVKMVLTADGKLGLGADSVSPAAKLQVSGGDIAAINGGRIGVGTQVPQYPLEVWGEGYVHGALTSDAAIRGASFSTSNLVAPNGSINVSGNITAGGTVSGATIYANYQDVAEWVPASGEIAAATVVILDPDRANHVIASRSAYDDTVAGVISQKPGIVLGVQKPSEVKVATTGRVKVKVDATKDGIRIGDLLVTSDDSGMAMKSQPIDVAGVKIHRPGTVIGKALEPLSGGKGEILVLLSLQ